MRIRLKQAVGLETTLVSSVVAGSKTTFIGKLSTYKGDQRFFYISAID